MTTDSHAAALRRIDDTCLGFWRKKHHGYLFAEDAVTGVLFEGKGCPVGYAYVWSDGHIGPLAVASQIAMGPAFNTALALAANQGADQVSAFLPGSNESAMSVALNHGMRLGRTMVLMSARPFGNWSRYTPNHPGFM